MANEEQAGHQLISLTAEGFARAANDKSLLAVNFISVIDISS